MQCTNVVKFSKEDNLKEFTPTYLNLLSKARPLPSIGIVKGVKSMDSGA